MEKSAVIDGPYRYELSRRWNDDLPRLRFCMLNPSTADALKDDPTIRRCIGFAKSFGYGGIVVVNLFAWRSTKPLKKWEQKHIGPKNDETIQKLCFNKQVICGWGNNAPNERANDVIDIFRNDGIESYCLSWTKSFKPSHPLYLSADSKMMVYDRKLL